MSAVDVLTGLLPEGAVREGGTPVAGATPEATASPTSVEGVVEVLRAASAGAFGVVPSGSALDLGPVPPEGSFIVLSTSRLRGMEVYEPADLTLSARAGSSLGEIEEITVPHGQWLPFDPPHAPLRTLGGLAATGVRGPLAASYGAPRDHILGLTLVTGDGRVLRLGGRVMKNVAGFDLVKLAVGSRGTLGVVVSVNVRLFPRPEGERALVLSAEATDELVEAARAVATAPVVPASAILVSGMPLDLAGASRDADGSTTHPAALVVRLHGAPETVVADTERLQAHVRRDFRIVEGEATTTLFGKLRDHAAAAPVVVRVSTQPTKLRAAIAAAEALGHPVDISADPLAGRVRAATSLATTGDLERLSRTVTDLEGSWVLEQAPTDLGIKGSGSSTDARVNTLARNLAERFDPHRVLWPGKVVR